jgi:V8-like Glu-specific endopeptidase
MTITRPDDRNSTTNFTTFPLNAVVAIDSRCIISSSIPVNGYGSGIIIDPNHVLTAGHNAFDPLLFLQS